jgi:hypothetical protein
MEMNCHNTGFLNFTNILQRYIAGFSKGPFKPLSLFLPKILTHVKEKRETYCGSTYTRSGVNQMWNSKIMLAILKNTKLF